MSGFAGSWEFWGFVGVVFILVWLWRRLPK